jgi:hypothetical protein
LSDIVAAEIDLLALPQVDCNLVHHFGPGIYIREVTIPEGTLVLGHPHKAPHLCILMAGTLRVLDGEGEVRDLVAPYIFTAPAGRKVGFAVEGDVVFQNIFATEETDIDRLEEMLVDKGNGRISPEEMAALGVFPAAETLALPGVEA